MLLGLKKNLLPQVFKVCYHFCLLLYHMFLAPSNPVASRALQEIQSMIEMLEKKPNKSIANTYLLAFAQKQYRKLSRPSTSSSTSIKQPKISKFLVDGSIIDKHEMRPLTQQKLRRRVSLNE